MSVKPPARPFSSSRAALNRDHLCLHFPARWFRRTRQIWQTLAIFPIVSRIRIIRTITTDSGEILPKEIQTSDEVAEVKPDAHPFWVQRRRAVGPGTA